MQFYLNNSMVFLQSLFLKKQVIDPDVFFSVESIAYQADELFIVPTTSACMWWNRPEEDLSSGKSESIHPSRTVVKSIEVFMESSQLYASTLTHYTAEPLNTRLNYDPLLLLLAPAGDVHPKPGSSRYP